ncbi:MAG: hypothetical protein U1C50_04205 [Patescibacteria group bacterium]|nr:hypothetical protein [bacterium]MDZ4229424.1 hypothetical protein [Patescibacteria group bacterium]
MIFAGIFGTIDDPSKLTDGYGKLNDPNTGLISFINNLLGLVTTIAGIFVIVNFIIAGYLYLSSNGEPQKIIAAGNKILQSTIGIGVVAVVYIIAAVLGAILYNDPTKLLQPTVTILL